MLNHYVKPIKKKKHYYNIRLNIFHLAWLLFTKDPIWSAFRHQQSGILTLIKSWLKFHKRFLKLYSKVLFRFIQYKLKIKEPENSVSFSIYGHICFPINRGFKVFHFRNKSVVKVFPLETDTALVKSEIERVRKAARLKLSPSVRLWNIEDRWYEEDYVEGASEHSFITSNPESLFRRYKEFIMPLVEEIIFFQTPIMHESSEYINQIVGIMENKKFSEFDISAVREIKEFFDFIVKKLSANGACQIYIAFTHGDFHTSNIYNTKYGLKVLDWELAEDRSLLHDFYNYFFHLLRHKWMMLNQWSLINEALSILCSRMYLKSPDLSRHVLSNAHVYRWIYYIERIAAILNFIDCVPLDNTTRNILHNIRVCKGFENSVI